MAGKSIDEEISDLLISAKAYQSSEPVYSLLLCRKAAEAFLMKKHLQMVTDGEAKEVLTLGDAYNNRLGLKEILSPLEIMSIQFIQNATNPFLHFRVNKLELREDLIPRVLQEVESITNVELGEFSKSNDSLEPEVQKVSTLPTKKDWRVVLRREIDEYNWPQDLKKTVLSKSVLSNYIVGRNNSIKSHTDRREALIRFKERIPEMTNAELRSELKERKLSHGGNKAKIVERFMIAYEIELKSELGKISTHLKNSQDAIRVYQDVLDMSDDERLKILKESTESGLIALYNASGEKWNQKGPIGKKKMKVFFEAVKDILPFNMREKTLTKRWKFLFTKDGALKSKWEFFDTR